MYAEVYQFTRFAYYFLIIMDRWGRMGTRSSFIRVIRSSAVKKEKKKSSIQREIRENWNFVIVFDDARLIKKLSKLRLRYGEVV